MGCFRKDFSVYRRAKRKPPTHKSEIRQHGTQNAQPRENWIVQFHISLWFGQVEVKIELIRFKTRVKHTCSAMMLELGCPGAKQKTIKARAKMQNAKETVVGVPAALRAAGDRGS